MVAGDPFSIGMGLATLGRGLLSAGSRGKMKRQAGALALKGIKSSLLAPGPVAAISAAAGALPDITPFGIAGRMVSAIRGGGQPVMRNGVPTFPITVSRGRRRMNPLNPRALRRAISRVTSFSKFARKTITITQRVKLKKRRRR
jgi:hypothetical protein